MVLVRRESRLRKARTAAFLSALGATVPALERDAASELPHARGGAGGAGQGSRLAGSGTGPGRQRPNLRCRGAAAPRSGPAAHAVPRECGHQPRVDAGVGLEAIPVHAPRAGAGGAMTYVLIASAALGGILLFLLAAATANSPLFAEHYPLLLGLNAAIALALLGLVVYQLAILARQRRAKVFGSLLTFRVLVMFALVGVVPGLLVYTVSLQFLAKSIESWFDVRVERALEVMLNELLLKAHVMALDLSETPRREQPAALARLREQAYVEEAWLMTEGGQVLARASREAGKPVPPAPSTQALRDARQVRGYGVVEPVGDKGLLLRVIVSLESARRADEPHLLQLTHWVPQTLAEQGESVQSVYRAYKELSLSRQGLKEIYILTLTLTLLLALLSAIALAFLLSRKAKRATASRSA